MAILTNHPMKQVVITIAINNNTKTATNSSNSNHNNNNNNNNTEVVDHCKRRLGFDYAICRELEVVDGVFTGKYMGDLQDNRQYDTNHTQSNQ